MAKERVPLDLEAAYADTSPIPPPPPPRFNLEDIPPELRPLKPPRRKDGKPFLNASILWEDSHLIENIPDRVAQVLGQNRGTPQRPVRVPTGAEGIAPARKPLGPLLAQELGQRELTPSEIKARFDANPGEDLGTVGNGLADAAMSQVGDVVGGALTGGIKAIKSTASLATDVVGGLKDKAAQTMFGDDADISAHTEKELKPAREAIASVEAPAPKTIAGNITESVSQFTVGMIGAGKLTKAFNVLQGAGKALGFARASVQGAMSDATVFDPTEARLSNLVEEYPSLHNPITEYLAADPTDSNAEGRFKNAVEGVVLGSAVEGLFASIRGVKRIREARAKGGEEAAQKELAAVADELEAGGKAQPTPAPMKPNVEPPEESIKRYMLERIQDSPLVDRPYSVDFNVAKQATSKGAIEAINLMSQALAPEIDKLKGGVQTFDRIKTLADIAGEQPDVLMARMNARASDASKLASDVVATEQMMLSLAREMSDEARKVDNGLKDAGYLSQLQDQLSSVVANLKAVKTGAARATTAGRIVKREALTPEQIKYLVAAGGSVDAVVKIIQPKTLGRKLLEAHNEVWIGGLLSGPKTHLVNMTSNLLNTIARPAEKMLGGQVQMGLAEYMGMWKGIKDSVSLAAKSWRLEAPILDPSAVVVEGGRGAISAARFGLNPKSPMGMALNWLGIGARLSTRTLGAEDELFKNLNFRANVYARATREGTEKGLKGKALAEYIEGRFSSAFDGTGKGLDDTALKEARIATFTEELAPGSFIKKVNDAATAHPAMRLIVPFIRTPTNIVRQLGHRTPLINLAMESYRAELKAGGGRAAAARGQFVTGGLLWSAGIMLAMEGRLTGRGPEDKDKRAALLATGWMPYSVRTSDGRYISYQRLDPYGMALGLAADFTESSGYLSEENRDNMATAMLGALSRNLTSKTYLRGLTEALDAFSQPDKNMEYWLRSRAGSYIPSGAQQIAGVFGQGDETMREARTMLDAIRARTPGLSQTLPPKRNLFGEPIHFPAGLGPDSISPFALSEDLNDPVKDELARLSFGFRLPAEKVGNVPLTAFKNEKGQDAYDRLLELRGIVKKGRYTLKERLAALIESDSYQRLPDGNDIYGSEKLKRVQRYLGEYQEATLKQLRKEFPEVDAAIRTDERNAKLVPRKGLDALEPLLNR